MSIETTILLPTTTAGDFKSVNQKGAGYHKNNDGVHTFSISFKSWSGELKIQGTLERYPSINDADWVTLKDTSENLIVFGDGSSDYDDTYSATAIGKFVWIRAVGTTTDGEITQIRYNY
jgi:hypothetical protein